MESIEIQPTASPPSGRVRPPGSKSLTNRTLAAATLAEGVSRLHGALRSEDTQVMIDSLIRLGIAVEPEPGEDTLKVFGCGGRIPATQAELYVANSGTTIRFLTALAALGHGRYRLDGTLRMRQRPIQDLLDALAQMGVQVESEGANGCPPVVLHAAGLRGGRASVRGDVSSQFLSGLLLAAPYAAAPVELTVAGPLVSQPYVRMTLAVMRAFGVAVEEPQPGRFRVPQAHYTGRAYVIEPDASAASYFFAAAAITGGRITVEGLTRDSLQGDVAFCDSLAAMGCTVEHEADGISVAAPAAGGLHGIDVDMNAISDTVQTLAVVALFAQGPTTIRNVAHIRHKETDRIGNLATELRKLGGAVEELADGLRITPGPLHGAQITTYKDHRMAMSLALAGLQVTGVVIVDPRCVEKTYPDYFRDLAAVTRQNLPSTSSR